MESQDFNKKLIDYLYGELTNSEAKEFEEQLSKDEALRAEYESLKSVREGLNKLEDKEVMEPFSIWKYARNNNSKRRSFMLRPITAIAASLIILMLVGYSTDFSIVVNEQGFQMGFHNSDLQNNKSGLTEDDVKRMVAQEIEKSKSQFIASLNETQEGVDNRLIKLEKSVEKPVKSDIITSADLKEFFTNMEDRNAQVLQDYLTQTSTQQQEYFKTMLTQFNEYLQDQRTEDLNIIQSDIMDLKYAQNLQKRETQEVIGGLLTSMGQKQN